MKSIFTNTILVALFILGTLSAQVEELNDIVGTDKAVYQGQLGGYILPSSGTLNVLIVFSQFPDDNYAVNDSYWVKGQPPANMQSWVDQSWSANPTQGSIKFDMMKYFI